MWEAEANPEILERGGGHDPRKGRSVRISKLTSQKKALRWLNPLPYPPPPSAGVVCSSVTVVRFLPAGLGTSDNLKDTCRRYSLLHPYFCPEPCSHRECIKQESITSSYRTVCDNAGTPGRWSRPPPEFRTKSLTDSTERECDQIKLVLFSPSATLPYTDCKSRRGGQLEWNSCDIKWLPA